MNTHFLSINVYYYSESKKYYPGVIPYSHFLLYLSYLEITMSHPPVVSVNLTIARNSRRTHVAMCGIC